MTGAHISHRCTVTQPQSDTAASTKQSMTRTHYLRLCLSQALRQASVGFITTITTFGTSQLTFCSFMLSICSCHGCSTFFHLRFYCSHDFFKLFLTDVFQCSDQALVCRCLSLLIHRIIC